MCYELCVMRELLGWEYKDLSTKDQEIVIRFEGIKNYVLGVMRGGTE